MKATEAAILTVNQKVEFDDGRLAIIDNQDSTNQRVKLKFLDEESSIGYLQWVDMSTVSTVSSDSASTPSIVITYPAPPLIPPTTPPPI